MELFLKEILKLRVNFEENDKQQYFQLIINYFKK